MGKYRKKPVVVEAEAYKPGMEDGLDEVGIVVGMSKKSTDYYIGLISKWYENIKIGSLYQIPYINTLEGKHYISPGDYIITGIKGERYPCKPDIFEMTYELA